MSATKFDLEKILAKVTAMLAKADSTEFPEEAKAFRAKAEQFMRQYRIEEEDLIASDQVSIEPEWMEMDICGRHNPFKNRYLNLIFAAAEHAGVQAVWGTDWKTDQIRISMCGYSGDLRMAAFLFNAARLVFKERLEPKVNPALSDEENIYRLRQSGIDRQRVAKMLWGEEEGGKHSAHAKVGRIYKQECERRGEIIALDGRGINLTEFKEAYARNFTGEFDSRLREARSGVDVAFGAVTLHGREERVKEVFYTRYPTLRPVPLPDVPEQAVEPSKPQKVRRWTKADEARYVRKYESAAAQAGQAAGKAAAAEVQIDRTPRARRLGE